MILVNNNDKNGIYYNSHYHNRNNTRENSFLFSLKIKMKRAVITKRECACATAIKSFDISDFFICELSHNYRGDEFTA